MRRGSRRCLREERLRDEHHRECREQIDFIQHPPRAADGAELRPPQILEDAVRERGGARPAAGEREDEQRGRVAVRAHERRVPAIAAFRVHTFQRSVDVQRRAPRSGEAERDCSDSKAALSHLNRSSMPILRQSGRGPRWSGPRTGSSPPAQSRRS
jgi:hypothetical protein